LLSFHHTHVQPLPDQAKQPTIIDALLDEDP
jgi:hypothetical protein